MCPILKTDALEHKVDRKLPRLRMLEIPSAGFPVAYHACQPHGRIFAREWKSDPGMYGVTGLSAKMLAAYMPR
jgi:hypothetical protein